MRPALIIAFICCISYIVPATHGFIIRAPFEQHETGGSATPPKLIFLFMTFDSLPNEEIWAEFFASQKKGESFEAFVHCEMEEDCHKNITHKSMFTIVPTVPSEWCYNLVGPMDALLGAALAPRSRGGHADGNPRDKFVFVSGSTAPVKSFCAVRDALIERGGLKSNFCISAQRKWAWHKGYHIAVKHHQWVVLSRAHAATIFSRREDERDQLSHLTPLHWLGTMHVAPWIHATAAKLHLPPVPFAQGCLDEYLYFALLFGYLSKKDYRSGEVDLPMNGGPLRTAGNRSQDLQGRCDTFATFGLGTDETNFTRLKQAFHDDPDTNMSGAGQGVWGPTHPIYFFQLSKASLLAFRNSPFLFARKIDNSTRFAGKGGLAEAFRRHILADCNAGVVVNSAL